MKLVMLVLSALPFASASAASRCSQTKRDAALEGPSILQKGARMTKARIGVMVGASLSDSELATLQRMKYWAPGGDPLPPSTKYMLFSPDHGGPNNIRIGWEMTGVIAGHTNRTLVLPPAEPMYLLDWGPMSKTYHPKELKGTTTSVESLLNVNQLKAYLPTLAAVEFEKTSGVSYADATKLARHPNAKECRLNEFDQMPEKFVFMDGVDRVGFSCGEWWSFGGPKAEMRVDMRPADWRLLRHGFVWHEDAFDIAAKVVNFLGTFNYTAIHARYGDFEFHDSQRPADQIFGKWQSWLKEGTTLYVATDDPSKFRDLELPSGVKLVMWDDLFHDSTGNLLVQTKMQYSPERWFKMLGPVEELICTYAKLFFGTEQSTFSGHIERMRIHAGAPVTMKLTHTGEVQKELIDQQIDKWNQDMANGFPTTLSTDYDEFL